jgi:6-phosphogluconolactonase/glucosamine-6-phosphate isomerase/deaminase
VGDHRLEVLDDPQAVHRRGAELIAQAAREAVAERGSCALGFSGGHDPWSMFSQLEDHGLDWTKTEIFQVD